MDAWEPQGGVEHGGVTIGATLIRKTFAGQLTGASEFTMHQVTTPVPTSASYVALERVVGALDGREGSFVLRHTATMTGGGQRAEIAVVPDSGTGQLAGLRGEFAITKSEDGYSYAFEYDL